MSYAATVTLKNGDVLRVYKSKRGGFTVLKKRAKRSRFARVGLRRLRKWARRKGWKLSITKSRYPFIVLDTDTIMPNPRLARKLNTLGKRMRRYVWIGEGRRSNYQQWKFRMAYLQGHGNLAARCCLKYWPDRVHSWNNCGKNSQSNHATGDAADTSLFMNGRGMSYTNIGEVPRARAIMRDLGMSLPVPGETWHVEISRYWAA